MLLLRLAFLAGAFLFACGGSEDSPPPAGTGGSNGGSGGRAGGGGDPECPPSAPNGWPFGACDVPSTLVCVSGMLDCCIPYTHSIPAESQCIDFVWQITNLDECGCESGAGGEGGSNSEAGASGESGQAEGGIGGERQ